MTDLALPIPHAVARCRWCHGPFFKLGAFYWCQTPACALRQRQYSIGATVNGVWRWLYVPLPAQVDLETVTAPYRLFGGAAGGSKSHGARWLLYKYAMRVQNFEALIIRRTFTELERTHLRRMAREEKILQDAGIHCEFRETKRQMVFPDTGAIIEAGHMEDAAAVDRYLSSEFDGIVCDEGAGYPPEPLLELSTRTVERSDRAEMRAAGGGFFLVCTNPIGPAVAMLRDFFITHEPDRDTYPDLHDYRPDDWAFVESQLEDNPYIGSRYAASLALYGKTKYRQLRHGDWNAIEGAFFERWQENTPPPNVRPHHVRKLSSELGRRATWFRSLDWGRIQPGCVGWWAILPEHHYHLGAELKFQGMSPEKVAEKILEKDAELGITRILYTAADPAIFISLQDKGTDIGEQLRRAGVRCRDDISNDRVNGFARLDALLDVDKQGNPFLTFDPSCKYLRRTIPMAQRSKTNPEDVNTDGDDHGCDMLRYGGMSRPPVPSSARQGPVPGSVGADVDAMRAAARND